MANIATASGTGLWNREQQPLVPNLNAPQDIFNTEQDKALSLTEKIKQVGSGVQDPALDMMRNQLAVPVSERQWSIISRAVSMSENPEEELSRYAAALTFSREYGISVDAAYSNLDALTENLLGRSYTPNATGFQAVANSFKAGRLNMQFNDLAYQFKQADLRGEDTTALLSQLDALGNEIAGLRDHQSRNILTTMFKWTAEGAVPYMIEVGKSSLTGATFAGALGTAFTATTGVTLGSIAAASPYTLAAIIAMGSTVGAVNRTRELMEGASYLQLRQLGIDKDIANAGSRTYGILVGAVEAGLGIEAGTFIKAAGGSNLATTVSSKVMAKMITSGKLGALTKGLVALGANATSEAIEEMIEEPIDYAVRHISYAIQESRDPDSLEPMPDENLIRNTLEAGVRGFASAIVLGTVSSIFDGKLSLNQQTVIKREAALTPSKEAFIASMKNQKPETITPSDWSDAMSDIWEREHAGQVQSTALESDENAISELDIEKADRIPSGEVRRLKDGNLYTQESTETTVSPDGTEQRRLLVGDPATASRYGYIDYGIKDNTITIEDVLVKSGYESIRKEAVLTLARQYPGYEILWEPKSDALSSVRDEIISSNPRGRDAGLQYWDGFTDVDDRLIVERQIAKAMPNLSAPERALGATLIQLRAEAAGMNTQAYLDASYKDGQIFGNLEDFAVNMQGKRGAVSFDSDLKAIIYAGQNADFSTFAHETFHVSLRQMGQLDQFRKAVADASQTPEFITWLDDHAELFNDEMFKGKNAQDLADIASTFAGERWGRTHEEFSARLYEGYLSDGKTASSRLKQLFTEIAKWMARIYTTLRHSVDLDPRIVKVFDSLSDSQSPLARQIVAQETAQNKADYNSLFQDEYALQYDEIESQYRNTDQWMKAPNGKQTNLTERQWVLVRTPTFIEWFGDWMNDPENASKVLDENGEPLVVYHGSPNEFDTFAWQRTSYGFFFAPDIKAADFYGNRMYEVFLDIKNPAYLDNYSVRKEVLTNAFGSKYDPADLGSYLESRYYEHSEFSELGYLWEFDTEEEQDTAINQAVEATEGSEDYDRIVEDVRLFRDGIGESGVDANRSYGSQDFYQNYQDDVLSTAEYMGYDGVALTDPSSSGRSESYVVYKSDQIKSATDNIGSFDRSNPSILYQESNETTPIEKRVSGDDLLNSLDMIDEIKEVGAFVDSFGIVTVYHATSKEAASNIVKTGTMSAKEDGLFFSTKPDGQITGYGESVVKLEVPAELLVIDDIFDDEAHLVLKLGRERARSVGSFNTSILFQEDKGKMPDSSPWALYQLSKVESVVTVRDNAPKEMRVYEVSMQPDEMHRLFGEDKPADLTLESTKIARDINSSPTRVADWQQIYARAMLAKGKNGKDLKFSDMRKANKGGKLMTVPVIALTKGCQRAQVTVERIENGVLPNETNIEACYGGTCWVNRQFNSKFKQFENMEVRDLLMPTPNDVDAWFKKASIREFLTTGPFIREGQIGCSSHAFPILDGYGVSLAETWLKNIKNQGIKQKTVFVTAAYAPVTRESYERLLPYKDLFEIHVSISGWFHKNELMIRLAEFEVIRDVGLPVSFRIVTNKDNISNLQMPNQKWLDKKLAKIGIRQDEILETPYHDDDIRVGQARSNPTGDYKFICCETGKCTSCGAKCMTNIAHKTSEMASYERISTYKKSPAVSTELTPLDTSAIPQTQPSGTFDSIAEIPNNQLILERDIEDSSNILFQDDQSLTDTLLEEARGFDSWQEWRDYYEAFDDPDSPQSKTDDSWYEEMYNLAHGISSEEEAKQIRQAKVRLEGERVKDRYMTDRLATDEGVREFLSKLGWMLNDGALSEKEGDVQATEAIKRVQQTVPTLVHSTILTSARRADKGLAVSDRAIKKIRGIMTGDALRYYRDVYADVMEDPNLKPQVVDDRLPSIEDPGYKELERLSISDRLKLANRIEAAELREKILSGKETFGGGVAERVIRDADIQIREMTDQVAALEEEVDALKERLSTEEQARVMLAVDYMKDSRKLDAELKKLRKLNNSGQAIPRGQADNIMSMQAKIDHLHDEIMKMRKDARLDATIKKHEAIAKLKEKIAQKETERAEAKRVRDYKIALARKIMVKPSDAINYEQAKAIFGIQALIDPNFRRDGINVAEDGQRVKLTLEEARDFFAGSSEDEIIDAIGKRNYERLIEEHKPLNDWTIEELEELANEVAELRYQGRRILAAKRERQQTIAQQYQDSIIRSLIATGKYTERPIVGTRQDHEEKTSKRRTALAMKYATQPMRVKAMMLDGNTQGAAYNLLVIQKRAAQAREWIGTEQRMKPVMQTMKDVGLTEKDLYKTVSIGLEPEKSIEMTYSSLMYAYLSQFDDSNKAAVAYGNLVTQDEKAALNHDNRLIESLGQSRYIALIQQAEYLLSEDDARYMKVLDAVRADFNEQKERINEIAIREFNKPMRAVEEYLPIHRKEFSGEDMNKQIADDLFNQNAGGLPTGVQKGFTKDRINISPDHQRPIDLDLMQVWNRSVRQQEHFIAFAEYGRKLNRVFKNMGTEDVRNVIIRTLGKEMLNDINEYINQVINPVRDTKLEGMQKAVKFMRGALGAAYLTWKMSSIVLQAITSPAPFLFEVNAGYLAKGYFELLAHPFLTIDKINELSPMMKNRTMNVIIDQILQQSRTYTQNVASRTLFRMQELGSMGLTIVDRYAVAGGWLGAYYQRLDQLQAEGIENARAEQMAIVYADDVTLRVQPTGDITEIAPLFTTGSEFARAFTQFTTAMNVIWNNITYDLPLAVKNKQFGRAVGIIASYALAGAVLGAVAEGYDDDDDEFDKLRKWIYWSFTQATGSVPLVGDQVDEIIKGAVTGDRPVFFADEFFPGMTKVLKGVGNLTQGDFEKALENLGKGAGYMIGLPISGLQEAVEAVQEGPGALLGR